MPSRGKIYSTGRVDILFVIFLVLGIAMIAKTQTPVVTATTGGSLIQTTAAIVGTAIVTLLVIVGAKFDRRCAEDYAFQMMAHAAFVAIPTSLIVHAIWDLRVLNRAGFAPPTSSDLIGVILVAWACAYAGYRIKGLNA